MHGGNYDDLTFVYNDSNTFDEKYFLDALNFGLNDRGFKEDLFKIIDKGDGVFDISKTKIIQRCNSNLSDHNYQIYEINLKKSFLQSYGKHHNCISTCYF